MNEYIILNNSDTHTASVMKQLSRWYLVLVLKVIIKSKMEYKYTLYISLVNQCTKLQFIEVQSILLS